MQMLRQRDFWAGAMFVLFGLFFVIGAKGYTFGSAAKMGPGFFPTVLGFILAGIGIAIAALSFFRTLDPLPGFVWRPLSILVLAICLFGILIPTAGFVLGTIALIVVGAKADPESRLLESLILGVLLSIFSTAVFHYGLGLPFRLWPNL
jgi:hypothetical protein